MTATPESIRVGELCAAARDRRPVTYADRAGVTRTGVLVFYPGNDARPHDLRTGRPRATRAKVQLPGGRYISVDPASVAICPDPE